MSSALAVFGMVVAAHAAGVASPGPDLAIVTRQTLAHGRASGLRTAWGVAAGIAVHMVYALFGLGWAIQRVPGLLQVLSLAGAVLLLWIGANALRAQPMQLDEQAPGERAATRDFSVGFATNVLNVKAMMFFVALCSAVVTGDTPLSLRLVLGAWMVFATGAWFSLIAWSLGHAGVRARLVAHAHWIDRVMGALLVLLGLGMLVSLLRG